MRRSFLRRVGALLRLVILTAVVTSILIVAGGWLFEKPYKNEKFIPLSVNQLPDLKQIMSKLRVEDVVINGFESKKELITMEVDLSQDITWDDSWGSFDIFSKKQQIRFFAKGIYTTDLQQVSKDDFAFDKLNRVIYIKVPKPTIKSITIDDDKTEFEEVETGWLRFGDIKLTPLQHEAMYSTVIKMMNESALQPKLYNTAMTYTQNAVSEIFEQLLSVAKLNFEVKVEWQ